MVRSYDVIAFGFQAGTTSFHAYTMPPAIAPLARLIICLNVKNYSAEKTIRTDHFSLPLWSEKRLG